MAPACAWRDRQDARADRRVPDRRLHGRRGARRLAHRVAGAAGRRRPHARPIRSRSALPGMPSILPGAPATAGSPMASTGSRRWSPTPTASPSSPSRCGSSTRPGSASSTPTPVLGGPMLVVAVLGLLVNIASLLRAAWRRPREPQHARRDPARAGRPARLGGGDRGGAGHPGHRLDADRPDPVGAGRRC